MNVHTSLHKKYSYTLRKQSVTYVVSFIHHVGYHTHKLRLSLSLSHTYTKASERTHARAHTHTHTHQHITSATIPISYVSLSLSHTHIHKSKRAHSRTRAHTHTHAPAERHTPKHTLGNINWDAFQTDDRVFSAFLKVEKHYVFFSDR